MTRAREGAFDGSDEASENEGTSGEVVEKMRTHRGEERRHGGSMMLQLLDNLGELRLDGDGLGEPAMVFLYTEDGVEQVVNSHPGVGRQSAIGRLREKAVAHDGDSENEGAAGSLRSETGHFFSTELENSRDESKRVDEDSK